MSETERVRRQIRTIEKSEIGAINCASRSALRLKLKGLEMRGTGSGAAVEAISEQLAALDAQYRRRRRAWRSCAKSQTLSVVVGRRRRQGEGHPARPDRATSASPTRWGSRPRAPSTLAHLGVRVGDPRESNTEGGVFPAIFGTVMMVILMSIVVDAARRPRRASTCANTRSRDRSCASVRIAVNNLAGVPSIVFGVFGLGFFIYGVGGAIDRLFFAEALPTPTFGTGGILWASLTLALLTVPVVIVATEEGLAAVPGGMREASLALGATKFETTLARGAAGGDAGDPDRPHPRHGAGGRRGGAADDRGVVKLAPTLPLDGHFPFVHLDRKFMHLGFHIYDVGFQSPERRSGQADGLRDHICCSLVIVVVLNLIAIAMRNRLRQEIHDLGLLRTCDVTGTNRRWPDSSSIAGGLRHRPRRRVDHGEPDARDRATSISGTARSRRSRTSPSPSRSTVTASSGPRAAASPRSCAASTG